MWVHDFATSRTPLGQRKIQFSYLFDGERIAEAVAVSVMSPVFHMVDFCFHIFAFSYFRIVSGNIIKLVLVSYYGY